MAILTTATQHGFALYEYILVCRQIGHMAAMWLGLAKAIILFWQMINNQLHPKMISPMKVFPRAMVHFEHQGYWDQIIKFKIFCIFLHKNVRVRHQITKQSYWKCSGLSIDASFALFATHLGQEQAAQDSSPRLFFATFWVLIAIGCIIAEKISFIANFCTNTIFFWKL